MRRRTVSAMCVKMGGIHLYQFEKHERLALNVPSACRSSVPPGDILGGEVDFGQLPPDRVLYELVFSRGCICFSRGRLTRSVPGLSVFIKSCVNYQLLLLLRTSGRTMYVTSQPLQLRVHGVSASQTVGYTTVDTDRPIECRQVSTHPGRYCQAQAALAV